MWDKLSWWMNRKPVRRWTPYISLLAVGFFAGIMAFPGIILLVRFREVGDKWWIGLVYVGISALYLTSVARMDSRHGYVDAMHRTYLEWRDKIGQRLGKIK